MHVACSQPIAAGRVEKVRAIVAQKLAITAHAAQVISPLLARFWTFRK